MYAARKAWRGGRRVAILMHREILGVPSDIKVDHRNGNGFDNRRRNLRRATDQQNQRAYNTPRKRKTSKYRGVSWHKHTGRWQAQISLGHGQNTYLGLYNSQAEAAHVYDVAARKHFGDFASPNFKI